jgi:hypothetical protein
MNYAVFCTRLEYALLSSALGWLLLSYYVEHQSTRLEYDLLSSALGWLLLSYYVEHQKCAPCTALTAAP